jgi:nitrogen fixation protein FixH
LSLIGFFGVMLIVNGLFVYFALSTFAGNDVDPYRRGLHYNETLAVAERQAEKGWQSSVKYDAKTKELALSLRNNSGEVLQGLRFVATVSRPATASEDRNIALEERGNGVYVANVDLTPGQWVVFAATTDIGVGGAPTFQLKQRLSVRATP